MWYSFYMKRHEDVHGELARVRDFLHPTVEIFGGGTNEVNGQPVGTLYIRPDLSERIRVTFDKNQPVYEYAYLVNGGALTFPPKSTHQELLTQILYVSISLLDKSWFDIWRQLWLANK